MGKDVPATAQCPLAVPAQPCLAVNTWAGAAHLQNPRHPPERLGTSWGDGRSRAVRPRQLWRSFRFSAPHGVQGAALLLLLMPGPLGPPALHPALQRTATRPCTSRKAASVQLLGHAWQQKPHPGAAVGGEFLPYTRESVYLSLPGSGHGLCTFLRTLCEVISLMTCPHVSPQVDS